MIGMCVESSIRYIPLQEVLEVMEEYKEEWDGMASGELQEYVGELIDDGDYRYNASLMSDFDYTYKEVEGKGVVEDTQEEWDKVNKVAREGYIIYFEVYDYQCSFYDYGDDCDEYDVMDLGKGAVSDCGYIFPEGFMS